MNNHMMRVKSIFYFVALCAIVFYGYHFFFTVLPPRHKGCAQTHQINIEEVLKKDNVVPMAIIGSGPAGLAAALYGARGGFHTVVFEGPNPGGQLMTTTWVENWPGLSKKLGPELIRAARDQAQEFGAIMVGDTMSAVDFNQWPFVLQTADGKTIHALTVVLATGATPSRLGVPGEDEYWGKGVTTCAICDAPFYKGAEVFVVGGGDSAAEEAMQLAPYASKITMLVRSGTMRASQAMQDRLKSYDHITIQYNTKITAIKGDEKHVTHVELDVKGDKKTTPIGGIFLAIGHVPNTAIFKDFVSTDKNGFILVQGDSQKTSKPGVFAAGDVADHLYRQAGIAAGNGIKAALDASEFLRDRGYNEAFAEKLKTQLFVSEGGIGRVPLKELESLKAFENVANQPDTPIFLDFFTEFCPTCMQMLPAIEMLAGEMKEKMKFFKVDAMKARDLAEKFEVEGVPAFLIIKNGELLARAQSTMSPQEIKAFVQKALGE